MTSASSRYTATDAAAYERLMGRWSPLLAQQLIAFAGLAPGARILDLGCGTGSLALTLVAVAAPREVVGVDIAPPYVAHAAARSRDERLHFLEGDGLALDFPDHAFDASLSLLALNFMADPARALAEMRRVTRPGGIVAAAVWDFAGGLTYQRIFWDTAAALDPAADAARAKHFSSPLTSADELERAFHDAGLVAVAGATLTIRQRYADFADYWQPIATAQGPVGDYVKALPSERRAALAAALERAYRCGQPDGPRSMAASAWAAKGRA